MNIRDNRNPADTHTTTKVTRLTGMNVSALAQAMDEADLKLDFLSASVAIFPGTPAEAWKALDIAGGKLGNKYGRRGHPVASIHAVLRKLKALATEPERGNVTTTETSDNNMEGADMTTKAAPAKATAKKTAAKPAAKTPAKRSTGTKTPAKTTKPAPAKAAPAKATAPAKGVAWLVEQIEVKHKLTVNQKTVRDAIRYLVRNDASVKDADIRDAATGRYSFRGITDANVKAIVAKVKDIMAEKDKPKPAAKPKATPAKKAPAKKAPAKATRKPAAKKKADPAPVEDLDLDDDATVVTDDDEVFNDDELDLD
ncbi:hypothetical protein SEA_FRIBS8_31 [Gordonia phage Fribs8]|nr:hypothetical protein SEA_FRIBS8_31 [Gordonia phage Fribs8]